MTQHNWHPLFERNPPGRRFSLDSPATRKAGRCLTVASQKGGVGKTTTVVNLAACYGLAGRKVLLFDFDPQANASSGVGVDKVSLGTTTSEGGGVDYLFLKSMDNEQRFLEGVRETAFENLWIFPSFDELAEIEMVQDFKDTYCEQWKILVGALRRKFDLIIIDCPPSLGGIPNLALTVSDAVIIPVQCEYYAMEGLSQILPVIEELKRSRNTDIRIEGLLLTMYSKDLELSEEVCREIQHYFPQQVFDSVIPRDVTLAESSSHGLPAVYYDFCCRGAWSYVNLTREVLASEGS